MKRGFEKSMIFYTRYPSPAGPLLLTAEEDALTGIWFGREPGPEMLRQDAHPVLKQAASWLDGYFRTEAPPLDFPIAPRGTEFQQRVWKILLAIPWGQVRSYGSIARELAEDLGKETMSAQAVGNAVGRNPISILIPCHRVVGSQGQLTGYAGGLDKKILLLQQEGWLVENGRIRRGNSSS